MSTPVFETPIVSADTSTGKRKHWVGRVYNSNGQIFTTSEFWQDGAKHQESAPVYPVGKQGRSDLEQGVFTVQADLKKKLDKGYALRAGHEDHAAVEADRPPILPMLAHGYDKRSRNLRFPCYAQAKENGFRAIYDGMSFWSRQGNKVIAECVSHLQVSLPVGILLDGELVLPEPFTFQQTCAAIKKYRSDVSKQLEYRVYDCYLEQEPDATMDIRLTAIEALLPPPGSLPKMRYVQTYKIVNLEELMWVHQQNTAAHREGTMARNIAGVYKPEHRSADLLKIKDTQDAEYPIVGYSEGQGKDAGTIVFTCRTLDGREFNVRPKGTDAERRSMFKDGANLIGQQLTVKYQTLTDFDVPLFPVGIAVRNYE